MLPTGKTSPFRAAKVVLLTIFAITLAVTPVLAFTGQVTVVAHGVDQSDAVAAVTAEDRALSGRVTLLVELNQTGRLSSIRSRTASGKTIAQTDIAPTDTQARIVCRLKGLCVVEVLTDEGIAAKIVVDIELDYLARLRELIPEQIAARE